MADMSALRYTTVWITLDYQLPIYTITDEQYDGEQHTRYASLFLKKERHSLWNLLIYLYSKRLDNLPQPRIYDTIKYQKVNLVNVTKGLYCCNHLGKQNNIKIQRRKFSYARLYGRIRMNVLGIKGKYNIIQLFWQI